MKDEQGLAGKKPSEKPKMEPKLGGSLGSKLDKQGDVKGKDQAVYVKAGIQDQKKQAGA
jgi:hypothetical protein